MSINVMGGTEVHWPDDVSYEELIKRCPFLSRNDVLARQSNHLLYGDIEPEIVPITKSKKRRLKKRLKAIKNLQHQECPRAHNSALLQEQCTESQKKLENKISSKINSKMSSSDVIEKDAPKINPHACSRTSDIVDGEIIISSHLHSFKNQDESKKKGKQRKNEHTELQQSHKGRNDFRSKKAQDQPLDTDLDNNSFKSKLTLVRNASSEKSEIEESLSKLGKLEQQIIPPQKREKSREEILAEREAKKKAKQLSKEKKKDYSSKTEDKESIERALNTGIQKLQEIKESVKEDVIQHNATRQEKSKAELRTERRMKQEAQRAAKEAEKLKKKIAISEITQKKPIIDETINENKVSSDNKKMDETLNEIRNRSSSRSMVSQRIKLFSHLPVGRKPSQTQILPNIHPAILELGAKYSARIINGSNARCIALLNSLKKVIQDYITPSEKEFSRGLESELGELTNYLNLCRPLSVSMTNALRHIKSHLTQLPNSISDEDARRKLCDVIDTFIQEQIDVAGEAICESVKKKITTGDIILIYSCSSLLSRILVESFRSGVDFSVVVVDGGPWFEGREMLRRLVAAGLNCTYVHISALSFIMRQATKVLLGAHALLANGSVMSRAGSSLVALMASAYNVPVLVCCETYKFCERVQTDVFVYNELGSPDDLSKEDDRLSKWESLPCLSPLSLVYDITPPDLVTAVVTEIAILPCTSVPVILRIKPSDLIL